MKRALAPPSGATLWLGGAALLWAMYAFVFRVTVGGRWVDAGLDAAANVVPLALLAAATAIGLRVFVMPRPVLEQAAAHAGLAVVFATTWYALVLVLLAFLEGLRGHGFKVAGFAGPAFTWQVFQGLILYALVAATAYAIRGGRQAAEVTIVAGTRMERYLTKAGDELVPVAVRDIVCITGAQDYAEVTTTSGRHLVRMSLNEFQQRLDDRFLRVHRSAIINFDRLVRTEPAGAGRLLAHLSSGDVVQVSRSGAQLLRSFVV